MEWTQEHVLELINLLYGKPELWDQKANRNKHLQIEALKDIALKMGRDVREVEKKLNYLRSQFSRELLRVRRSKSNNEDYEPKWFAFKPLSFLIYKRHINKPIQDKDREDLLLEQSVYFTPYERKLLDVLENPSGENNNEINDSITELNKSVENPVTATVVTKPTEIKVRRRSTRKSIPSVKQELYNEFESSLELLESEDLLLTEKTPKTTVNVAQNIVDQNINDQNTPKNHLNPEQHPMKKMRVEKTNRKLKNTGNMRYRNYDLINAKLKFVALQKKFLMQEHKKKEEINRLQLEHEKYKLEITKLEVEKKKLDIQIRSKMVD